MNPIGKKARRENGLNRHALKKANHTIKSEAKVRRMGWHRSNKTN